MILAPNKRCIMIKIVFMKKKWISNFLFLFILFCLSQDILAQTAVNQLDKDGKRDGPWEKFYDNNRVRYRGTFKHGKEVGTFKYFSAENSDFPVIVKVYNDKNNIAEVKYYTTQGVLESEGQMDGKNRVGKWIFYHIDGKTVMSEENYVDGKLHGPYKTFYNDGTPTEIANYKNGLLDGNYKKYAIRGHLINDFNYIGGKLNGMATYYSLKSGELIKKGPFKDDQRVGTWENYVDGELVSTEQPAIKPEKTKK